MSAEVPTHLQRNRAESFGTVASEYDRVRPSYPAALIDDLVALEPRDVLDVGCGTGKAARLMLDRGLNVLGVEIDAKMAAVAREHGVTVEVASFETWQDAGRRFDLITCGQAWHWIDPEAGVAKATELLRPGGWLVPFWNYATLDPALQPVIDDVYQRLEPQLVNSIATGRARKTELEEWHRDPRFASVETRTYEWELVYPTYEWLALIQTHSDHLQLSLQRRRTLLQALAEAIDANSAQVVANYTTSAIFGQVARNEG